jgi:SAM-dependent methyltransferase
VAKVLAALRQKVLDESDMRVRNTGRAFSTLPRMQSPRVLDIGCGSGGASVQVAQVSGGHVVGVDIDRPALRRLLDRGNRAGIGDRVHPVCGSMAGLGFPDRSFDIIWCEGATFPIGIESALGQWSRLLTPGGFLVLHEPIWYQANPPAEIRSRCEGQGPQPKTEAEYLSLFAESGYDVVGHFLLPQDDWWTGYYEPLQTLILEARPVYSDDPATMVEMDRELATIASFRECMAWYGSAFFILRWAQEQPSFADGAQGDHES